jgi:hypothetical protein
MRAKCGSRAIPPVGSFTPPRRIPVVNICGESLFFFTKLIINDFFKESIPIVSEFFPKKRSELHAGIYVSTPIWCSKSARLFFRASGLYDIEPAGNENRQYHN